MKQTKVITALSAVTTTTTSSAIPVEYAEKVTLALTATGISTGNGVYTITGSFDGTTYYPINTVIDNVANTNVQTLTRVASKTLSANGSALVALDLENFGYYYIKITVTRTTDGSYSAVVLVEY